MVAHLLWVQEAGGSSPPSPTVLIREQVKHDRREPALVFDGKEVARVGNDLEG